jgi:hypothetical protein
MSHKSRKSHKSRESHKSTKAKKGYTPRHNNRKLPRTKPIISQSNKTFVYPSKASSTMSLTELQHMAKVHGIPFGGLKKTQLAEKINFYNK